jgi:hypothetical protein
MSDAAKLVTMLIASVSIRFIFQKAEGSSLLGKVALP